ncbi:hypothetical protein [Stenotrophomonas maltophilia]|uniref:Uncharacterized protein n=1 Tax=Stenotrophomonas maltophilia TaxID=40324 RepID=A0AAI9C583_STEMA|nr:hypothetical protein [Stenotrophomonas maltophilia]EKT4094369.1 hypothetical protein [Stenotrophomonas maltophilia]HDS1128468.1 hypothetical protein [Stenotrophomonas maltophilia]HDS1157959.1 hypothetical protein [Stenotrophomonas maltophilia]HDS1167988.1 hypothetical protein [Stenotrophomonas maltophilia]HDS1168710.1 hypothetical protein [Stenotrophomonas maltophilia]
MPAAGRHPRAVGSLRLPASGRHYQSPVSLEMRGWCWPLPMQQVFRAVAEALG